MNKEIVSFNSGEMTEKSDALENVEKYQSGCRHLESMLPRIYGSAERRPGTIIPGLTYGVTGLEFKGAMYYKPHYALTYISENGTIWGIPLNPIEKTTLALDEDGVARDVGGGVVGLPCASHPFEIGEVVRITETTNFNGAFTLGAGTTNNELQITDTYVAEIFDGTEVIVKYIGPLNAGAGHMISDSSGNLYYGHGLNDDADPDNYYITKIETDGTIVYDYDFLNKNWTPGLAATITGLAITPDDQYLYLWIFVDGVTDYGYMFKFDLTTGDQLWTTLAVFGETSLPGYDMALDADVNAYAPTENGEIRKFDSADGLGSFLTLMGEGKEAYVVGGCPYAVLVDDDMGIVICGGAQWCGVANDESVLYNLAIRTLDDSEGAQIAIGGTYVTGGTVDTTYTIGTGMIITHNGFFYVISYTPTCTIYKLDSELNIITSVAGPTYGQGLYVDLWGNIVVVNQDQVGQSDIFWFYDTDLNYLAKIDGFYTSMLSTWSAPVGGAWIQGDTVFPTPKTVIG